jgi:hypothetical protein
MTFKRTLAISALALVASTSAASVSSSSVSSVSSSSQPQTPTHHHGHRRRLDNNENNSHKQQQHPNQYGKAHNTQSTSQYYYENTTRQNVWETIGNVTLGLVASVSMLAGLLFLVDRDLFDKATNATGINKIKCRCAKPVIIDDDDDNDKNTTFVQSSEHLTEDTLHYLAEKQDEQVEKPKRRLWAAFRSCWGTKQYDDSDKYRIPQVTTSDEELNEYVQWVEEAKLRVFWTPAKVYTGNGDERDLVVEVDKYSIPNAPTEGSIQSDYESTDGTTVPWS